MTETAEKRRFSQKTADFRRFTLLFGNSSIWRAQDFRRKPQIFAENRRKPQIGLRHLRCVTFSSTLTRAGKCTRTSPRTLPWNSIACPQSGTKKGPKPKLLSPDIFRWGRGLAHEGVGAKKFGMPLETREIKLFCRDIPGFCRDIPGVPGKFEKKKVWVQFSFPTQEP